MRMRIVVAALGLAVIGAPTAAEGAVDSALPKPYEVHYVQVRHKYVDKFGLDAAGRNIVTDGYRTAGGTVRPASKAEVTKDTGTMLAQLQPAPAPATAGTAAPTTTTTASYGSATSSTAACESGGNYGAVNPAGYYGAYQFDQSTWNAYAPAGYAGVNPASAPPAVQDAAAASVPYDAWPNCP